MDEPEVLPCAEKLSLDSFAEAEAAALTADWQHGVKLKPYQCNHCELWHLSSARGAD